MHSMFKLLKPAVLAAALPLAACVPTAAPDWLVLPADPAFPVRPPRYSTATAGVQRFDVVDPKDWRELNRQVTRKAGEGGMGGMDHSKLPGTNAPGLGG